jgi:D-3-phosphoglycerate dehydrogenase
MLSDRSHGIRVLSTARLAGPAVEELRRVAVLELVTRPDGAAHLAAADLARLAPDFDVLVVETEPVTLEVLRANPALAAVGCCRGNPVNVDTEAAAELGIPVLYAPGRNVDAAADFTMGLLIAQVRSIGRTHHLLMSGRLTVPHGPAAGPDGGDTIWQFPDGSLPSRRFGGPELRDLTLGILGCGRIGQAVATRARAFGMDVIGHDPYLTASPEGIPLVSLEELLERSDVVTIHARLTAETTGLVGRAQIARMKPGAVLINTARARIVDEAALVEALRDGRLGGAGLDVFSDEPLADDSPFLGLDNVTLTPHLAGASSSVVRRHTDIVLGDLLKLLRGEAPRYVYRAAP